MESQEIIEAAKKRSPLFMTAWYTRKFWNISYGLIATNKQRSVVLLDQNGYTRVRALASRITLAESV